MTKNLSAAKRDQVALRNNARNRNYKSAIKTLMKSTLLELNRAESIDIEKVQFFLSKTYSKIDKAVKKGIMKKNSAARKKSILLKKLKNKGKD